MQPTRILIVEDEQIVAKDIEYTLENLGHTVVAKVVSGESAIHAVTTTRPNLILMDIRLKGTMDGITAAAQIQDKFDVPIIFLTAHADEVTLQRAKITRPFGYLLKPFKDKELAVAIEVALYQHQMNQQLQASERRYRQLLESITNYVYTIYFQNGQPVSAIYGPGCEAVTGYTPPEYNTNSNLWYCIIHEADYEAVIEQGVQILLGQEAPALEHRIRHKDGSIRWVRNTVVVRTDERGQVIAYDGLISDITARKQVEEELRKSEAQIRAILDTATDGIITIDGQGVIQTLNPAAEQLFGYRAAELVGQKINRLMPLPEQERHNHYLAGYLRTGQKKIIGSTREVIGQRRNGTTFPLELSISELKVNGQYLFTGIVRDITGRKLAEEALRQSEERFRLLVKHSPDIIFFQDRDLRYSWVFNSIPPLAARDIVGKTDAQLFNPEDARILTALKQQVILTGVGQSAELWLTMQDGMEHCFEVIYQPRRDASDQVIGLAGYVRDITRRKRLEERLQAIYQLGQELTLLHDEPTIIRRVLELATGALRFQMAQCGLVDPEANCLRYDYGLPRAAGIVLPLDGERGIGVAVVRTGQAIVTPYVNQEPHYMPLLDNGLGGSDLCVPLRVQQHIRGVLNVESSVPDYFTPDDRQLLQILADQTAVVLENARLYRIEREQIYRLQQSQAQLIQIEKMAALGRLIASIAHEINNPLQAIQNALVLVEEETAKQQRREKLIYYAGIAKDEITRISAIVRRMRDFYRLPKPGVRPHCTDSASVDYFYRLGQEELQWVELYDILESVLQLVNKQLQHSRIKVELDWADTLPSLQASPDHLKQVFLNLVLNAIDAMAEQGGTLHLKAQLGEAPLTSSHPQPVICIKFSDTGAGMSAETLTRLFEPLFTTKEDGTGFGLFTSYKIIEAHHGRISVESQVGIGTTFTILLPLEQSN